MLEPPTGIITFLFTDIVESTRRWEAAPAAMAVALARHDTLIRAAVAAHDGYIFGTAGDSFTVAFADPTQALRATLDAQAALQQEPWVSFSSGYIQRALAQQPKQGSKRPWKLYQNYALDLLSLRFGRLRDAAMVFSR